MKLAYRHIFRILKNCRKFLQKPLLYFFWLANDMKMAVPKNHLKGQIVSRKMFFIVCKIGSITMSHILKCSLFTFSHNQKTQI